MQTWQLVAMNMLDLANDIGGKTFVAINFPSHQQSMNLGLSQETWELIISPFSTMLSVYR